MKCIPLQDILQPGQNYILDYAKKFNKEVYAVEHNLATNTCFEKAELLGWEDVRRVVKTVFYMEVKKRIRGSFMVLLHLN